MHRTPEGSAMPVPHAWQGAGAPAAEMGDADLLRLELEREQRVMTTRMEAEQWRRRWRMAVAVLVGLLAMWGAFMWAAQPARAQSALSTTTTDVSAIDLYAAMLAHRLNCPLRHDRDEFAERLKQQYGERRIGASYLTPQAVLELYTNPDKGTWTILRTNPHGKACPAAAGQYNPDPTRVTL